MKTTIIKQAIFTCAIIFTVGIFQESFSQDMNVLNRGLEENWSKGQGTSSKSGSFASLPVVNRELEENWSKGFGTSSKSGSSASLPVVNTELEENWSKERGSSSKVGTSANLSVDSFSVIGESGKVTISYAGNTSENISISIVNVSGRTIVMDELNGVDAGVTQSYYIPAKPGVYFVTIYSGSQKVTRKVYI